MAKYFMFILGFVLQVAPSFASTQTSMLQERALQNRLWEHPYWRKLLHYRQGSGKSEITDISFFQSSGGWETPERELLANIELLFSPETYVMREGERMLVRCKFPARYKWLSQMLAQQDAKKQLLACKSYEKFRSTLESKDIWFVFAQGDVTVPEAAFGNTFLRFTDKQGSFISQIDSQDQALSYGAEVSSANSFLVPLLGITGSTSGNFSLMPYVQKAQENNLNARNLWSSKLLLSEDEKARIIDHIWEILPISNDFYFFTQNCSYQILALIEIAKNDLYLRENLPYWTIPLETVRVIGESHGLASQLNASSQNDKNTSLLEPGQGHKSSRFGFGARTISKQGFFVLVTQRFAQHDILDTPNGHSSNETLEFLNIEAAHGKKGFTLDKLTIAHAKKLPYQTPSAMALAWEMDFGLRKQNILRSDSLGGFFEFGAGSSYWLDDAILAGFIKGAIDANALKFTLDIKPSFDFYYFAFAKLRSNLNIEVHDTFLSDEKTGITFTATGRYSLRKNEALEGYIASDILLGGSEVGLRYFVYY